MILSLTLLHGFSARLDTHTHTHTHMCRHAWLHHMSHNTQSSKSRSKRFMYILRVSPFACGNQPREKAFVHGSFSLPPTPFPPVSFGRSFIAPHPPLP